MQGSRSLRPPKAQDVKEVEANEQGFNRESLQGKTVQVIAPDISSRAYQERASLQQLRDEGLIM